MSDVDMRTVYLSARSTGDWYYTDPGVYHTSRSCAARDRYQDPEDAKEWYLERAWKEGYRPCGICATGVSWGDRDE